MSGQTLDLVVLGFGLLSAVVGYRRGLVRQAANLVGLVAGLLVARRYASDVAGVLADRFPALGQGQLVMDGSSALGRMLALVLAFVGIVLAVRLVIQLAARVLEGLCTLPVLHAVNRVGGALFATAEYALAVLLVLNLLRLVPHPAVVSMLAESACAQQVFTWTADLTRWLLDGRFPVPGGPASPA
ncbi:MAG: CvpA family protein [Calditerricola sp.]|jgi:Uncharacterized membrane protein, required for colicin V production|nr:CvpA family protein [Calditerricola sp.]